jgi:hypothetical protein
MEGCYSLGTVYRNALAGSIVEVPRIEGKIFKTMKEAQAHGTGERVGWIRDVLNRSYSCS